MVAYNPNKQIPKGTQRSFNIGYFFLQFIYHQLKLDEIYHSILKKYNFSFDLNAILSRLIYMRILHPTSKKGTFERATELLEPHSVESQHIYRALTVLADEANMIETSVYKNSQRLIDRNTSILYYDCTNFYFEIEESEGLKQYGVSKEHQPNPINPIIQMGLFMDGSGLPLAFVINLGNQNEQPTLKPLEKRILKDFKLSRFVVCTDAGLSSHENRLYNSMGNRAYVTTQSIKKLKNHLKEWALDPTGWTSTNHTEGKKKNISLLDLDMKKDQSIYYKERWIHENGLDQRLIVTFSPRYKRYHESIREKQIERAPKKSINQLN